jgi:hypothetical protein
MSVQIQFRRGTAAQWANKNPLLAQGEPGVELDTEKFKVGDGVTLWNSLPYGGLSGPEGPQGVPGTPGQDGVLPSVVDCGNF